MLFDKIFIQPKSLILIFVVTAVIVITSSLIELNESKKELLSLMESQSNTLLETLLISSDNALTSYNKIEEEVRSRLLNNANTIKNIFDNGKLTNKLLKNISQSNNILHIDVISTNSRIIFSSSNDDSYANDFDATFYVDPILANETDTLIIGMKSTSNNEHRIFAVAVASENNSAIVLIISADELMDFRKKSGFGYLLKNVTENKNILYAVLQDYDGIIAGSGNTQFLEDIDSSDVLTKALDDDEYLWRITEQNEISVFEAIHPFIFSGEVIGLFRLGLSMEAFDNINTRITTRIILLGIGLIIFGFVTYILIFTRQNFDVLKKRFKVIESYSNQIIENVNDAIIVLDENQNIKSINHAALALFKVKEQDELGNNIFHLLDSETCRQMMTSEKQIQNFECRIQGVIKYLLISKSKFKVDEATENTVLIIKDLTDQKILEKQISRNERLTAMGELASSVAHEIRNPLNAIGTITQQLNKDFEPKQNVEEYKSLSQLVYKEVKRINETIEEFLRFAKPIPFKAEEFNSTDLFSDLHKQYQALLDERGIIFEIEENWRGQVKWDRKQISQSLINLIENAIDSLNKNSLIKIAIDEVSIDSVQIKIVDKGAGIPKEIISKIFNLYFTTKAKGSGIGLSIVQKIISEHNGVIFVDSSTETGTTFTIQLPKIKENQK